jgi:hypothetical protein
MAARHWTSEQKKKQAELIRHWSPWNKSTGPQSEEGKQQASRNAFKGGRGARLRALSKEINELLRKQQDFLGTFAETSLSRLASMSPRGDSEFP